MASFQECMDTYKSEFKKLGVSFDEALLEKVTKGCGPSIYNNDSATVAATDKSEVDTVKNNFLIKKLGLSANDDLDGAIAKVVTIFGSSNRNKYRAMFYYMLTVHFKKESVYNQQTS
jgi:hypothetical protein